MRSLNTFKSFENFQVFSKEGSPDIDQITLIKRMDRLTFGWITNIILQGFGPKDVSILDSQLKEEIGASDEYNVKRLQISIFNRYRRMIIWAGLVKLISDVLSVLAVHLVRQCIIQIKQIVAGDDGAAFSSLILPLSILLTVQLVNTFCMNHQEYMMSRVGLSCSRSLMSQIFASSTASSSSTASMSSFSSDNLVNLMTVDVQRVEGGFSNLHYIWSAPLQSLLIFWSLYQMIGLVSLFGIGVTLLYIPTQCLITRALQYFRKKVLVFSDRRLKQIEDTLGCIKIIRAMLLDKIFSERIKTRRSDEVRYLWRYHCIRCLAQALNFLFTVTGSAGTLLYLIYRSSPSSSASLVAIISLFKLLRVQLNMIPLSINALADANLSLKRIQNYLSRPSKFNSEIYVFEEAEFFTIIWQGHSHQVQKGSATSIEGSNGSGKSRFLASLTSKLSQLGEVSYCPQSPWLQSQSIRDNILFGLPYNHCRYNRTLSMCQLVKDFEAFSEGDERIINQGGTNLSGGQRQRICLARLVYSEAPIWIIDDIFSSLDSVTSEALRKDCIEARPKGVTLFFVGQLTQPDQIIKIGQETKKPRKVQFSDLVGNETDSCVVTTITPASIKKEIIKETGRQGNVGFETAWSWIKLNGGALFLLATIILLALINQCRIGSEMLVVVHRDKSDFAVFLIYSAGQILCPLALTFLFFTSGLRASTKLHKSLIEALLSAPLLKHFAGSPMSLILNRLGKDQESLDNGLIVSSAAFAVMSGVLFFTGKAMVWMNWKVMSPLMLFVFTLYWIIAVLYRRSMREAKRLESISRTPICSRSIEISSGLPIIQGLHRETAFIQEMSALIDRNASLRLFLITGQVWFTLRIEVIGALITFLAGGFAAWTHMNPALAGLIITYCGSLSGLTMWTIRQFSHAETNMIAYERITDLRDDFVPEALDVDVDLKCTPADHGIEFKGVTACFGSLPYLRGLSVTFSPDSKTCIIGRTGCGKSGLLLSILRIYPVRQGEILIGGHNISRLPLEKLREAISYVPQEPLVFLGESIRFNLDPLGQLDDLELWSVLKCLKMTVASLDDLLTTLTPTSQKEFICLGRAILSDARKILLMDEPLASVDTATLESILGDAEFNRRLSGKTVLIVTHRPEFIRFCDHLLKLDSL